MAFVCPGELWGMQVTWTILSLLPHLLEAPELNSVLDHIDVISPHGYIFAFSALIGCLIFYFILNNFIVCICLALLKLFSEISEVWTNEYKIFILCSSYLVFPVLRYSLCKLHFLVLGINVRRAQGPPRNLSSHSYSPKCPAYHWASAYLSDVKAERYCTMGGRTSQNKLRKEGHLLNLVRSQKAALPPQGIEIGENLNNYHHYHHHIH